MNFTIQKSVIMFRLSDTVENIDYRSMGTETTGRSKAGILTNKGKEHIRNGPMNNTDITKMMSMKDGGLEQRK